MYYRSLLILCLVVAVFLSGCYKRGSDRFPDPYDAMQVVKIQNLEIVVERQPGRTVIERFHGDFVDGSSEGMIIRANNNRSYEMSFTCVRSMGADPTFYLSLGVDRSLVSDEVKVSFRFGNEPHVTVHWQTRSEGRWRAGPKAEAEAYSWVKRIIAAGNQKIEVWIKETAPSEESDTYALRFENRGVELEALHRFLSSESGCGYPHRARRSSQIP